MFQKWYFKIAKWYQFWYPQSGLSGGAILGLILVIVVVVWVYLNA